MYRKNTPKPVEIKAMRRAAQGRMAPPSAPQEHPDDQMHPAAETPKPSSRAKRSRGKAKVKPD